MTDTTAIAVDAFRGEAARPFLPAVAALRIEVFREWPYLYDGSLDYEERYLASYAASPSCLIAVARAGGEVVGAATAMPLAQHGGDVAPPLAAAGYDPATVYYFGESVLRPVYRGRRLGHAFFDAREAAARALGFRIAAFCAVQRPPDHPARPADHRPHDEFWRKRGFVRRPDIVGHFGWRDVGDDAETIKPMTFWIKELA
jgi:GNAT superfamily N-acetyltransferase